MKKYLLGLIAGLSIVTGVAFAVVTQTFQNPIPVANGGLGSTGITGIVVGTGSSYAATTTTGSGSVVLQTSPTLITPILGVASSTAITVPTLYTATRAWIQGLLSDSVNATGTNLSVLTSTGTSTLWIAPTGTVAPVFSTSPTLVTPILGVASSTALSISGNLWDTGSSSLQDLRITKGVFDSINTIGASGQVLSSTGTSTLWIGALTNAYASSTFPSFTYGTSTYAPISTTVTNSYASSTFPSFTYATNTYAMQSSFTGTIGKLARWTSASALGSGIVFSDATVAGVNATSSSYTFNIQGAASTNPFNVASSTGTSMFNIAQTGNVTYTGVLIKRVTGLSSAASTTVNTDTTDIATTTVNQATTFVNPSGTANDGQAFEIRALATTTQTVYFGTIFATSTDLNLPTTIASGTTRFLFEYDKGRTKWDLTGKLGAYNP